MEGFSAPENRSDRVVLEANLAYGDPARFPRLKRIVVDNTLGQQEAVELVKTGEGRVDLVTDFRGSTGRGIGCSRSRPSASSIRRS
jgi:hypothetical protein